MSYRKLLFIAAALLVVCHLGWAQKTPTKVQTLAVKAAQLGKPLAVIPESARPLGQYRPHIWVSRPLTKANPSGLPGFCNAFIAPGVYVFCPNGVQTAYQTTKIIGANGGAGMIIAIVDAFHYAGAEADLNQFSSDMALPPCTKASGCFTQVNQVGGPPRASSDSNWEVETMLDLEYAHAMAPNAKLVLVEGDDSSFDNLAIAVTTALTTMNANVVSNSYGALEFFGQDFYDATYNVNKPIFFSSGDNGAPTSYPCASPFVTCVGGTTLNVDASLQRISETGWSGSGGGCSAIEPSQTYQLANGVSVCGAFRATPDIAAEADPNTGVAVFDSGNGGYFLVGGTSLATPLMAGIFADIMTARLSFGKALLGFLNGRLYNAFKANYPYFYYDVLTGNNGFPAGPGFDLVTGVGVSKGPAMGNRFFGLP